MGDPPRPSVVTNRTVELSGHHQGVSAYRGSHTFRAPLPEVWKLFVNPELWALWNTEWSLRDIRGPFDHPGAGYTQVLTLFGREWLGSWEVVECDPLVRREIRGVLPMGWPFEGSDWFTETANGTRVDVEIRWQMPWGMVGRALATIARPVMAWQMRGNARRAEAVLAGPVSG